MRLRNYQKIIALSSFAAALAGSAMGQTDSRELEEIMRGLEAAGSQEVSLTAPTSDSLEGFSDRLRAAVSLNGQTDEGSDAGDLDSTDRQALDLMTKARSFSEAKLLAQVMFERRGQIPPVPSDLSDDPTDPDWQFAGYSPDIPEVIARGLKTRREARDKVLDTLEDSQFDIYAGHEEMLFQVQSREAADARGLKFDPRPSLYALDTRDGQVWLRKQPAGYVEPTGTRGEPSQATAADSFPEIERPQLAKAVLGGDQRQLRSAWNGHNMGSHVWEPKGAIVPNSSHSNDTPPAVNCTGVKISARLVLTAGHCFHLDGSWNSNRKWLPGADGVAEAMGVTNDPSPNGGKNSWRRYVRSPWHDHEWSNYDFGIMVLYDNASSCGLHHHGWWNTSLLNKTVHLYGYPASLNECSASPLVSDSCFGSIYGDDGKITYAGSYKVRYPIDTQDGQSGTGFYRIHNGTRYVVGVHTGPWNASRNRGVRLNNGNSAMIQNVHQAHPANACN